MRSPWTVIAAPHNYSPSPSHLEAIAREIEATGAVGRRLTSQPGQIEWEPGVSTAACEQLGFEFSHWTRIILKCSSQLMAEASPGGAASCPRGHSITHTLFASVDDWIATGTEPLVACPECGQEVPAGQADIAQLWGDDPASLVHTALVVSRLMLLAVDATIENFDTPLHQRIKEILGVDRLQYGYLT